MRRLTALAGALAVVCAPMTAHAWGHEGHEIIADIAYAELTPAVRAKVDAMLADDTDPLTAHDIASEATWADAYRNAGHRETASWHFVDDEIDAPGDLRAACFGFPVSAQPASAGPAQDCVVDKIEAFRAELAKPATPPGERLLALKYLLHLIGDEAQPLHASDHQDRGGNCVHVSLGGVRTTNLHSFWDTTVVQALGEDSRAIAATLQAEVTPSERQAWAAGDARAWALDSYAVARSAAYTLGTPGGCGQETAPVSLPAAYQATALTAAKVQLQKAGVRLASVLNGALGG